MSGPLQYVDELPPEGNRGNARGRGHWKLVADELRRHPGQWAAVNRLVPPRRRGTFRANTQQTAERYGLEYSCRTVDGVLTAFMRAPEVTS